jgi:hypothetical protein
MSYARFGQDGSDVYVFLTSRNSSEALECCACNLIEPEKLEHPFTDMFGFTHEYEGTFFFANTAREMIDHLIEHRAAGHTVNDDTISDIINDFPDLDKSLGESSAGEIKG